MVFPPWRTLQLASALLLFVATSCTASSSGEPGVPKPGDTSFISADGGSSYGAEPEVWAPPRGGVADEEDERTIEEGDLYRVFGEGLLLHASPYRGLQVIDLGDLSAPTVLSRLELGGTPAELYVVGERALMLLDGWERYGLNGGGALVHEAGSLAVLVDLSTPAQPKVLDQQRLDGSIVRSRLSRLGDQVALYVAAQRYPDWSEIIGEPERGSISESNTSSDGTVSSDEVPPHPGSGSGSAGTVSVQSFRLEGDSLTPVDTVELGGWITAIQATPEALLVAREGASPAARASVSLVDISRPDGTMREGGQVEIDGIVRNQFNLDLHEGVLRVVSGRDWHRSTNQIQTFDAATLAPLDRKEFGPGEDLFATLFVGNAAFFVTYERQDPFHAFEIDDEGVATEKAQFIVSGWNDFFRTTFEDRRLVGIGVEDTNQRTMAVSLYDITDLENPNPLVAREMVAGSESWSEASWDHRAFSILEGAVSIEGEGGVVETGLVLLPFVGRNSTTGFFTSSVQLFTFSEGSLTRRGVMEHGLPVRRSFSIAPQAAANLSDDGLSLFSFADPEAPEELGRLDLAPNFRQVVLMGDVAARLHGPGHDGRMRVRDFATAKLEIVSRALPLDSAEVIASFEVPSSASLFRLKDLLIAVDFNVTNVEDGKVSTRFDVFDLSDPASPTARGSLQTRALIDAGVLLYDPMPAMDCFDCFQYWEPPQVEAMTVGDRLLLIGREYREDDYRERDRAARFVLWPLDLGDPDAPHLEEPLRLDEGERALTAVQDGERVFLSVKKPHRIPSDPKPYARYYLRRIDWPASGEPVVGPAINVPGELLALDGSDALTRDYRWRGNSWEEAIVRVRLEGSIARLLSQHSFAGQEVDEVRWDGAGLVVVEHYDGSNWKQSLTILEGSQLEARTTVELPSWAWLREAISGRALLQVSGGLLLYDLGERGRAAAPMAFLPTLGWPEQILRDGASLVIPAGRFGIHELPLDAANLPRIPKDP